MVNLSVNKLNIKSFVCLGFLMALTSRLLPHPPNMTAMNSFAILAGANLTNRFAIGMVSVTLLLSDLLLSTIYGYSPFGSWTLFALTGYIILVYAGSLLSGKSYNAMLINIAGSLFFWLWTNLGVWFCGRGYAFSVLGLIECYTLGLPFLVFSLLGDLLWMAVMVFSFSHASLPGSRSRMPVFNKAH